MWVSLQSCPQGNPQSFRIFQQNKKKQVKGIED